MTREFHYEKIENAHQLMIVLSGVIDENAVFPDIQSDFQKKVIIDLDQVEMINSIGIRNWVLWIKKLHLPISLQKCPPSIIEQINILIGFLPDEAHIDSFYVPYYCENCLITESILLEESHQYKTPKGNQKGYVKLPNLVICSKCKGELDIDVLPQKYFKFING